MEAFLANRPTTNKQTTQTIGLIKNKSSLDRINSIDKLIP